MAWTRALGEAQKDAEFLLDAEIRNEINLGALGVQ